jgi:hypothetical protein
MEQDDKTASMSEKDRKMASRFESAESKDDDDETEEKEETKKTTKIPKKSLFFTEEKPESEAAKTEEKPESEKKNFLTEFFTKDVDEEPAADEGELTKIESEIDDVETPALDSTEQETSEFSGEVSLRDNFEEVVVERLQEVGQELQLPDAAENLNEIEADAEFLEDVSEHLEEGMEPEQAIDIALEGVLSEDAEGAEGELSQAELANAEAAEAEEDDPLSPVTPVQRTTASRSTPPPPVRPPVPPTRPPVPPTPPTPPAPATYYYNPNTIAPTPATPNSPNVPSNPNVIPPDDTEYGRRRSGDLLLGGIVGYMIGRRGGRKRTEARLEPEIKKRDAQLEDLKTKLEESEVAVRVDAATKAPEASVVEKTVEVPAEARVIKEIEERVEHISVETIKEEKRLIEEQEKVFEQLLVDVPQVETNTEFVEVPALQESRDQRQPEKESEKETVVEKNYEKQAEVRERTKEKPEVVRDKVEAKRDPRSMSMPELLAVADHIMYEKASLRQLYERHRIDAVNLRRVVIEYFNGGTRYERLLLHSLEAVEMQRELRGEIKDDPGFRASQAASDDNNQTQSGAAENVVAAVAQQSQNNNSSQTTQSVPPPPQKDTSPLTNTTAVVVGILAGIVVLVVILLSSNSL